ncbi:MAG: putative manganese transporter [bacterium]
MRAVFQQSLMVTSFIFMMMVVIEYLNVLSKGAWQYRLRESRWGQYLFAAIMGIVPGCLGAFTVVSLYAHGITTVGALVTAMIATSGDEAFFMLAMIPGKFLWITAILIPVSLLAGWLTDFVLRKRAGGRELPCDGLVLHPTDECFCFTPDTIIPQLKNCSLTRGSLCIALVVIVISVVLGILGPQQWNWIRITLLLISVAGLFIVVTVPEHFLEEHLWKHIARHHLPRIFLWTLGTLAVLAFLQKYLDVESWIRESRLIVLLIACLIGIIPESGPHLVFITLYAQGMLPFSVLLANSAVQDGHGMLPLLAQSRRDFLTVKGVNVFVGLVLGLAGYWGGW